MVGTKAAGARNRGAAAKRGDTSKPDAVTKRTSRALGARSSRTGKGVAQAAVSGSKTRSPEPLVAARKPASNPKLAGKPSSRKAKLVRDSFTFPEPDYALFAQLKTRALSAGREVKKSELLRAGLVSLASMTERSFLRAIDAVERIKTGRPSK